MFGLGTSYEKEKKTIAKHHSGYEYDLRILDLDFKYNKINEHTLEINKAKIRHSVSQSTEPFELTELDIKVKFNLISKKDAQIERLKITQTNPEELKLALLNLRYEYGEITAYDRDKERATFTFSDEKLRHRLAEIDYEYDKIDRCDLELVFLDIQHNRLLNSIEADTEEQRISEKSDIDTQVESKKLDILLKHNRITQKEFDAQSYVLLPHSKEKEILAVQNAYHNQDITEYEMEKRVATINGDVWCKVVNSGITPNKGFAIEMDWNDAWIADLRKGGFHGKNDEEIIQQWQTSLYKEALIEEGMLGEIFNDAEEELPVLHRQNIPAGPNLGLGIPKKARKKQ